MLRWIEENDVLLAILGGVSLLVFVGTILAIPLIVACMPQDHFLRGRRGPVRRTALRRTGHVLKNFLGGFLVLVGLLLLLLPGQGILTILIGISLIDFPGKQKLQVRLARLKGVQRSIQWIRKKTGHPPLIIPDYHE